MIQFSIKEGSSPSQPVMKKLHQRIIQLVINIWSCCFSIAERFLRPNVEFTIYHVHVELQNITRDFLLLLLAYGSWKYTAREIRDANEYTWFPIQEVAKLFVGIFITIIPAIAILKAGTSGALASIINSVSSEAGPVNNMYFWLTGILLVF